MIARQVAVLCILAIVCAPGVAHTISSLEQRAIVVDLCGKVISDCLAYLAGQQRPTDIIALEREYAHCAEIIQEHEDLSG